MLGPEESRPTGAKPIPESMPMGTGRKTLKDFCAEYNRDLDEAVRILTAAGLEVNPDKTLKDIAEANAVESLDLLDHLRAGYGE